MLNALYILELNEKPIEERLKIRKKLKYTFIPLIIIGIIGILAGLGLFSFGMFISLKKMDFSIFIIISPIIFFISALLFVFGLYRLTLYKNINIKEED